MRAVARAKEPLSSGEKAMVVFVPPDSFAGSEGVRYLRHVLHGGFYNLEKAWQEHGTALVSECKRLLGGQCESAGRRVVGDESSRSLRREPLANIPLGRSRLRSDLRRGHRSGPGHRLGETDSIADEYQRRIHRGSHLSDRLHDEFV